MKLREKSEEDVMNDLSPFGFIDDGSEIEDILQPIPMANWLMPDENVNL
jgi:hypothetical protein